MAYSSLVLYILGTLLILLNAGTAVLNHFNQGAQNRPLRSYSFVEEDYPAYYPITLPAAMVTVENSVHFQLWKNETVKELGSLFPSGGGFLYLGPEKRAFGVAMYHQLHCMSRLESAFFDHRPTGHTHHCFNYIRQAVLCEANPTLEPILLNGETDTTRPRVCKDWTVVHDLIEKNHNDVWEKDQIWW